MRTFCFNSQGMSTLPRYQYLRTCPKWCRVHTVSTRYVSNCVNSYSISRMGTKINPPPKKIPRVSSKTQTTFGTPKSIFCFINNIRMTTSNCFEYAKNPHVNDILTKKNPRIENFNPQNIFQSPQSLEIWSPPPPPPIVSTAKNQK